MTFDQPSQAGDLISGHRSIIVRAFLLGERLDIRGYEQKQALATTPLTVRMGRNGYAVLFRYGVTVLFDVSAEEEAHCLADLSRLVTDPLPQPGYDQAHVDIGSGGTEHIDPDGNIVLAELTPERMQIIADVLAKDVMLDYFEIRVANVFDRVEPLARRLKNRKSRNFKVGDLLSHIGDVLLTQHRMVGRAGVLEKPEVLWNSPELEGLFGRLEREYEIRERSRALDNKLEVISDTAETLLDLVHTSRSLRVEWYIVGLIVFEILLSLYEKVFAG
ncbi:MAG: RMD1 family protein [Rhodospirillaceae bacterium]|nr:RMD1 family protein [Rhodospirillales bacterium]